MAVVITGTGSFIPEQVVDEQYFMQHSFYNADRSPVTAPVEETIRKFKAITGIEQRRYARPDQQTSDIATLAAIKAIEDAGIDPETLDGIILAHNYGNVAYGQLQSDTVPSMATRVKHNLKIRNPDCVAFDVLFGCPGWIQGMIIADQYLQNAKKGKYLIVGAETLSRLVDPHDRDSMIYADGAGATVLEWRDADNASGILSTASRTFTYDEAYFLHFDESLKDGVTPGRKYIKMYGRKIYEFALNEVPQAMKVCLDRSGTPVEDLKKVFLHQANGKMDEAIIKRFLKLYDKENMPDSFAPMTIHNLGNSSVATVPTLLDLVLKEELGLHRLQPGDVILMASVGAGMNINAITYRM